MTAPSHSSSPSRGTVSHSKVRPRRTDSPDIKRPSSSAASASVTSGFGSTSLVGTSMTAEDYWAGAGIQLSPEPPPAHTWKRLPVSPFRKDKSKQTSSVRLQHQDMSWMEHPWNKSHHITFSRHNSCFNPSLREFFPTKPEIPMCLPSMHPESFAPFAHAQSKQSLLQEPLRAAENLRPPKFSHELWQRSEAPERPGEREPELLIKPVVSPSREVTYNSVTGKKTWEAEREWNPRASSSVSWHNTKLHPEQRQYFFVKGSNSSFTSPVAFKHNIKWRSVG